MSKFDIESYSQSLQGIKDFNTCPSPGQLWFAEGHGDALILLNVQMQQDDGFVTGVVYQIGTILYTVSLDSFLNSFTLKKDKKQND